MQIDPKLKEWATPRQAEVIEAINRTGGINAAARELGLSRTTVQAAISGLRGRAAKSGYSPEAGLTHPAPSPFTVKGVSTLYDADGVQKAQWVKTAVDQSKVEELVRAMVDAMTEEVKGKAPIIPPPKDSDADLLAVYPQGDPHFGMYAWAAEAGDDFDTDIAERITCSAIDRLVASAPNAETALVLPLGDLIHADSSTNRTPNSGATLDVDTRWPRVMQVALRCQIYVIKCALKKHKRVVVRIVKGNHDPHASFAIALALDAYFHNEPRVQVDLSPAAHWYFRFGKVLIGSTHGDTTKQKDLLGVMAADRAKDWGETEFRYWYCGHIHHIAKQEYPGVIVEYFRTLAPKDAWHAGQGYRSGREMVRIVHHKLEGETERQTCSIARLA